MRSAAARMMIFPTSVEPVNDSLRTSGCWASGPPHSSPRPVSTLSTPGGRNSWRAFGGLQYQRIAGAKRRRDLQRAEQDRRVPRDDCPYDTQRLASRIAQHLLAEGNGLALQLAGEAAEIAEDIGGEPRLAARLGA